MNLAGFAAAARAVADRAEESLAIDCARAASKELLAAMFLTTPVLTGRLRASEIIQDVDGDGAHAVALVGPDGSVVYDKFRNFGGTIRVKHAKVLGTPAVGFFGKQVTQAGSHYMERAEDDARSGIDAVCQMVVDELITLG